MRKYEVDHVKIRDKGMVRDMRSKAVLSTDLDALNAYKDRKKAMDELDGMKADINNLKNTMNSVLDLLKSISNK